ncbi:unnamed protein product [Rotaria socialis]|nr:unnamed protein product [Rotaria socialis]CAF4540190.1 unnamed protein product [Rotaria socialis]
MKRGNYSKEDFLKAVDEYKKGVASAQVTAKYNIPSSTIRNHKSNPTRKIGGGRPTILNKDQEQYLVELLKNLEINGVRLTKSVVRKLASEYAEHVTGKSLELGRKWLLNFLTRWKSELKLIREEKIESGRRNDFTEDVRRGWFEKLGGILRTNNLITKPHAIFNCCESGFSDETSCEWVMVSHGTKHAYEQCGGSAKNFTTSLICGNAAGDILPPFVIYASKNLNPQWTVGGPPGSKFASSESGWITKSLFVQWFKWFVEYTKDVTKYLVRTGRTTIRKIDLPSLFNQLYSSAFTPKQVVAGFSRAGVWPFDSNAMKENVARQPLAAKQLNQQPSPSNSANQSTSSTQVIAGSINHAPVTTLFISPSSLHPHDQYTSYVVPESNYYDDNNLPCIVNGNHSNFAPTTVLETNLPSTTNLDSSSISSHIKDTALPQNTNRNLDASFSSSIDAFDLLSFPSFDSNASFNSSLFNNFDLQSGELNNSLLPIDKNLSFNQISESLENFSKVPIRDVIWYDNDGQRILGFDPLTLPKPLGQHSGYSNDVLQPKMSVTDFEKENDENNRMYTELQTVTMQRLVAPFESSQRAPINIDTEMINPIPSTQLSSPSAVRSIVTNLIQQHIPPPSSSSNTTKRTRGEGKYCEEITSSNRLNDLKEKSSKLSSKKRSIKSTTQTSETSVFASGDDLEVTKKKKRRI